MGDLGTWVTIGDSCGVRRAFTAAAARPAPVAAGAGMPQVLDYIKDGDGPWGEITTKSGSEFVLMQTGLSLVVRPRG